MHQATYRTRCYSSMLSAKHTTYCTLYTNSSGSFDVVYKITYPSNRGSESVMNTVLLGRKQIYMPTSGFDLEIAKMIDKLNQTTADVSLNLDVEKWVLPVK